MLMSTGIYIYIYMCVFYVQPVILKALIGLLFRRNAPHPSELQYEAIGRYVRSLQLIGHIYTTIAVRRRGDRLGMSTTTRPCVSEQCGAHRYVCPEIHRSFEYEYEHPDGV